MPWSVDDVEKHNKGLSDKKKRQWVHIANSVLKKCMADGGTEKSCAAKAIQEANGVVNNNEEGMLKVNVQLSNYKVSRRKYNGKDYMIIPVTMMVEGVHNGSQGPILHEIGELGKIPESYNGIPIVINHPVNGEGAAIPANSPEVLEDCSVGIVFGSFTEDAALKAQAWLEELKLQEKYPDLYERIDDGEEVEVSLGVFTDNTEELGEWNGESFIAKAKNHRPDHLALLPNSVGACSLKDGCGLGVNSKDVKKSDKLFRKLLKQGFAIHSIGNNEGQGYYELMSMVSDKLRSMDTQSTYHYAEEVYTDSLIYNVSGDNKRTMYKQAYKIEGGKIEFVGEPIEVHRKVEYVININNNSKKEDKMSKENKCPKCVEKINALIANKESGFTEEDREWLNDLTEPQLDKVVPKTITKEVHVEVNKLTDDDKAALEYGKRQLAERRAAMVKGIQDNTEKGIWAEEDLKKMDDKTLEGIYKSVTKKTEVDFSLNSSESIHQNNEADFEPLVSGGVKLESKK